MVSPPRADNFKHINTSMMNQSCKNKSHLVRLGCRRVTHTVGATPTIFIHRKSLKDFNVDDRIHYSKKLSKKNNFRIVNSDKIFLQPFKEIISNQRNYNNVQFQPISLTN